MKKLFVFLAAFAFFATGSVVAQDATTTTDAKKSCAKKCAKSKSACSKTQQASAQEGDVKMVATEGYEVSSCATSGNKYATKVCGETGNVTTFAKCGKSGNVTKTVTCGASGKVMLTEAVEGEAVPSILVEGEVIEKEASSSDAAVLPGAAKKGTCTKKSSSCTKKKATEM